MSFGCERSCSSARRVSNFNSNVPQGIYPHIKFDIDPLNLRALTSSGSTGGRGRGGDAKTIILTKIEVGGVGLNIAQNHSSSL